ncbi:MAG: hypothetical protein U0271_24750 [Polyangiaceae bacterium]
MTSRARAALLPAKRCAALDGAPSLTWELFGRARRARLDRRAGSNSSEIGERDAIEILRLGVEDTPAAERLAELGKAVGVLDAGRDDEGIWLVRATAEDNAAAWMKRHRGVAHGVAWERVVRLALDVADALAACEQRGLFPGALGPEGIGVSRGAGPERERAFLTADELFARELGAPPRDASASLAPAWCPPAQADGAPFDAAANRYVLGLTLYKLLAGAHPFSGAGLRRALDAAKTAGAPPFADEVASKLPPGLQSLVLRTLSPNAAERPASAEAIADALTGFLRSPQGLGALGRGAEPPPDPEPEPKFAPTLPSRDAVVGGARPPQVIPIAPKKPRNARAREAAPRTLAAESAPAARPRPARRATPPSRSRSVSWPRIFLPIGAGALLALGVASRLEPAPPPSKKLADVGSLHPLAADETLATDCASCHPRQTSEWRRSVMGHAVKSPLFNALESLVEEQIGRSNDCPNGGGALRKASASTACRSQATGLVITGSGGEHWCVNCHAPNENLELRMPAWDAIGAGNPRDNHPVKDLLGARANEGIDCAFCHQVHGPVTPRSRGYQGNPTWTSFITGTVFESRPEDRRGLFGIANSGYELDPRSFLSPAKSEPELGLVHERHDRAQSRYLASSEFCGTCHDVRLFGSDAIAAPQRGEHFKRLRNAYSEWDAWAALERKKGREPATCQGCHMSTFPGVCEADAESSGDAICPSGTRFTTRKPGDLPLGRMATGSKDATALSTHYFSGVDLPLSREYPEDLLDESALDLAGIPISARARRDALLKSAFDFEIGASRADRGRLSIPIEIENVGGGHRVPAGFSQEREFWVHLRVTDRDGRVVYEVGRVDRDDEDLHDKVFRRVNTDPTAVDFQGQPIGLFGADVADGPDVPLWSPPPSRGGTRFTGRGLINFQNGFLRCVSCIGIIQADGSCAPGPGQGVTRADRFVDGGYDLDTGECRSNLVGENALFETYFPVGSLDATRGAPKAPDAIIDTRSVPPEVPLVYTYDLDTRGARGPFTVEARLLFRAFPPFLIKAFADYERAMDRLGRRPSGPLVDDAMLSRLEVVEIARRKVTVGR